MKLAVTSGFDKSLPALLMADRLRSDGHQVVTVVVVSPYSAKRLREMLLSRGLSGFKRALNKLLKGVESGQAGLNPLQTLKAEQQLQSNSLKAWCAQHGIAYQVVNSINEPKAVETIAQSKADMLVYGGGGILRAPIIDAVGGMVVNPHAGPLPEVRGMNAIEWATLLGERQTVTVHLIDTGIDTGKLIAETPVPITAEDNIDTLRAKAQATGVCALTDALKNIEHPSQLMTKDNPGPSAGRQCYPLGALLTELLATKLKSRRPR